MPNINIFLVNQSGTLSLEGYRASETRMDAYGISSSYFMTHSDLALEADTHQPVLWELQNLFTNWRDAEIEILSSNSSNQDSAEVFQTKWDEDFLDDADNVTNWLKQLSKEQFSQVSKAMLAWGSGDPSCDDDDFIDEPMSGQDMAYQMFSEGCYADEAEVLGIEIVEGDHPGSSYYAAELSITLAEANKKAESAGFDLRFRAEDKNAHGLEQEQHKKELLLQEKISLGEPLQTKPSKVLAKSKAPVKKTRVKRRAVLVVVIHWPSGTMARKFGDVMQAALDISKDGMNLVQMAPERIFRVETTVSEAEFREVMRSRDVASGGNVLFVEIPNT